MKTGWNILESHENMTIKSMPRSFCVFFRKFLWFFSLNIVIFFLVSYSLIRIVVFWFGFGLDFGQNNRLGSELGKTWILSLSMSVVKYSSIRFNQSAIVISTWVTHYSLFIKRTLAQKKMVHSRSLFHSQEWFIRKPFFNL